MSENQPRNNIRTFAMWAVATVLFFYAYQSFNAPSADSLSMPYNHFTQNLDDVKNFSLSGDQRSFAYILKGEAIIYESVFPPGKVTIMIDELQKQGTTIDIEQPPTPMGLGTMVLMSIVPVFFLIGALVWLSKRNGASGAAASFGGNPAHLINPEDNNTTLADVAGNPGDFDDIHELIEFLHNPAKFWKAGAELPRGILLFGPPGVGKTLLARAIAGEAKVPFFTISGSDFVEMFVGVGASRVRSMFVELKKAAPAILFIDEIDALGSTRDGGGGGNREHGQTLNQLLVEMDGFEDKESIMIIGATNRPELLDSALMRPGRFDRQVPISLPDINAREKILEVHTKDRKMNDDIDLRTIAKGTPGFSGADLKNLVNEAAMIVAKHEREEMQMSDLDAARDQEIMGREKSLEMSTKEKEMTAYHEAGHAIVGYNMPEHDPVYKISIIPRGRALGVTMYLPEADKYSYSQQALKSQIVSLMGGRAAEELEYGNPAITTGAGDDLRRATSLARNMVTKWGFSETGLLSFDEGDYDLLSENTKEKVDNQIRIILDESYKKASTILKQNKAKLKDVALALVEQETINFDEFCLLIGVKNDNGSEQ